MDFYSVAFTDAAYVTTFAACLRFSDNTSASDEAWQRRFPALLASGEGSQAPPPSDACDSQDEASTVCIIFSHWPLFEVFHSLLLQLHQLYVRPTGHWRHRWLAEAGLAGGLPQHTAMKSAIPMESLVRAVAGLRAPQPGQLLALSLPCGEVPAARDQLAWPTMDDSAFATLFGCLRPAHVARVLASLLLEWPVLLHSASQWRLQAACSAVCALLAPLQWESVVVPVLPLELVDMIEAPVPHLVGVLTPHMHLPAVQDAAVEGGCVVVSLDTDRLDGPGGRWGDSMTDSRSEATSLTEAVRMAGGGLEQDSPRDVLFGGGGVMSPPTPGAPGLDVVGDVAGRVPCLPPPLHCSLVAALAEVAPAPHHVVVVDAQPFAKAGLLTETLLSAPGMQGPPHTLTVGPAFTQCGGAAPPALGSMLCVVEEEGHGSGDGGTSVASSAARLPMPPTPGPPVDEGDGDDHWRDLFTIATPSAPAPLPPSAAAPTPAAATGQAEASHTTELLLALRQEHGMGPVWARQGGAPWAVYVPWGHPVTQLGVEVMHATLHQQRLAALQEQTEPPLPAKAPAPRPAAGSPSRQRSNAESGGELQLPGGVGALGEAPRGVLGGATSTFSGWVRSARAIVMEGVLQLLATAPDYLRQVPREAAHSPPPATGYVDLTGGTWFDRLAFAQAAPALWRPFLLGLTQGQIFTNFIGHLAALPPAATAAVSAASLGHPAPSGQDMWPANYTPSRTDEACCMYLHVNALWTAAQGGMGGGAGAPPSLPLPARTQRRLWPTFRRAQAQGDTADGQEGEAEQPHGRPWEAQAGPGRAYAAGSRPAVTAAVLLGVATCPTLPRQRPPAPPVTEGSGGALHVPGMQCVAVPLLGCGGVLPTPLHVHDAPPLTPARAAQGAWLGRLRKAVTQPAAQWYVVGDAAMASTDVPALPQLPPPQLALPSANCRARLPRWDPTLLLAPGPQPEGVALPPVQLQHLRSGAAVPDRALRGSAEAPAAVAGGGAAGAPLTPTQSPPPTAPSTPPPTAPAAVAKELNALLATGKLRRVSMRLSQAKAAWASSEEQGGAQGVGREDSSPRQRAATIHATPSPTRRQGSHRRSVSGSGTLPVVGRATPTSPRGAAPTPDAVQSRPRSGSDTLLPVVEQGAAGEGSGALVQALMQQLASARSASGPLLAQLGMARSRAASTLAALADTQARMRTAQAEARTASRHAAESKAQVSALVLRLHEARDDVAILRAQVQALEEEVADAALAGRGVGAADTAPEFKGTLGVTTPAPPPPSPSDASLHSYIQELQVQLQEERQLREALLRDVQRTAGVTQREVPAHVHAVQDLHAKLKAMAGAVAEKAVLLHTAYGHMLPRQPLRQDRQLLQALLQQEQGGGQEQPEGQRQAAEGAAFAAAVARNLRSVLPAPRAGAPRAWQGAHVVAALRADVAMLAHGLLHLSQLLEGVEGAARGAPLSQTLPSPKARRTSPPTRRLDTTPSPSRTPAVPLSMTAPASPKHSPPSGRVAGVVHRVAERVQAGQRAPAGARRRLHSERQALQDLLQGTQ